LIVHYFEFYLKGNGFESDISLDDISLIQGGSCAYFLSTTQAPTSPQTAAYECNFEDSTTCDWVVESPNYPWIIGSGETAVYGKAPLIDYTKQNTQGKYAYVPIEPISEPMYYATLSLRSLAKGAPFCLDFWYQTFVSSDTTLNVYMNNNSNLTTIIWRRPGTTARDQWTHGSVNLGTILGPVHLSISGKISIFRK